MLERQLSGTCTYKRVTVPMGLQMQPQCMGPFQASQSAKEFLLCILAKGLIVWQAVAALRAA